MEEEEEEQDAFDGFVEMEWTNGVTQLSKATMDEFQGNIKEAFNKMAEEINETATLSTTEKVVGTWIDGKPIYRKVLEVDLTNEHSTNTSVPHGISNLANFIRIDGILIRSSDAGWVSINSYSATSYRISVVGTTSNLNIQNVGYVGNAKYILEYTKTTD